MVWEIFYPEGSASEGLTLQWAADHWYCDKTTRPTDFHSLEDLTIHSYWARIIAILKLWIHQKNKRICLHDSKELGKWLAKLSIHQWTATMDWLDVQMEKQKTEESLWNNHWNNHI